MTIEHLNPFERRTTYTATQTNTITNILQHLQQQGNQPLGMAPYRRKDEML